MKHILLTSILCLLAVCSPWLCYSTTDMKNWIGHGTVLSPADFKWALGEEWASQVIERDGKFYYYTTMLHSHWTDMQVR